MTTGDRSVRRTALKAAPQLRPVEVAADEHQPADARLALLPRADEIAVGDHVHRLEGEAPILASVIQDAFCPQQVRALLLQQHAYPGVELLRVDWPFDLEAHGCHILV